MSPDEREAAEVAARNRELWERQADGYQADHAAQLAASGGAAWGVWQIPEDEIGALGEVAGRDVLELGCGAAQWSIALAARGARVTGLDASARQLEHARELMAAAGADFQLVHAGAEETGLPDAAFDVVFCDHGAMSFADPHLTVLEAARLLRPGGLLAFSMWTPLAELAWPVGADHPGERLVLDYWDLRISPDEGDTRNFQLPYGEWLRLFAAAGLIVEDLIELRPPADAVSSNATDQHRAWARRWPMEHIWRVRKR